MPIFKGKITSEDFANTLGDEQDEGEDDNEEEEEEEENETELSKDLRISSDKAAARATSDLQSNSKDEAIAQFQVGTQQGALKRPPSGTPHRRPKRRQSGTQSGTRGTPKNRRRGQ
jgi:hypothetical protein